MRLPSMMRSLAILLFILSFTACAAPGNPALTTLEPPGSETPAASEYPPTATSTNTPVPTITQMPFTPTQAMDLAAYVNDCEKADRLLSETERQYAMEQLVFPTDLSEEARRQLNNQVIVKPSCNVRLENVPEYIVIHATRGGLVASIAEFQGRHNSSAHYIIDRDGQIYQMVPEGLVAFHVTCCLGQEGQVRPDYTQSIGIELVNKLYINPQESGYLVFEDYLESFGHRYWEDYPVEQVASLVTLVEDITARRDIPMDAVIGHYRVNDTVDPGPALNLFWRRNGNPPRDPIFSNP